MKIFISVLSGCWGASCVALMAIAAGAKWGTIDGFAATFFGVLAFHVCAFLAYTSRENKP